ncbi:hypothetical protein KIPE111705_46360 [Kibdelosporangium persicum]
MHGLLRPGLGACTRCLPMSRSRMKRLVTAPRFLLDADRYAEGHNP